LNRCQDKDIVHFKKYIPIGVMYYKFYKLVDMLQKEELKKRENLASLIHLLLHLIKNIEQIKDMEKECHAA